MIPASINKNLIDTMRETAKSIKRSRSNSNHSWITRCGIFPGILLLLIAAIGVASVGDRYKTMRQEMVKAIEADVFETSEWIGRTALDRRVMEAMGNVPRHEFVPPKGRARAYENRPLPIGYGQTISQPYIVALMTELLEPDKDDVVLEIGTGSGYQAAILSALVKEVYTIEIIKDLGEAASARLERLGYGNIQTRIGDGYYGWKAHSLYDGIIVTAAAGHIPPSLIRQLKPGGRMVIPVGSPFLTQRLMLVEKDQDEKIKTRQVLPVRFVPLTGKH